MRLPPVHNEIPYRPMDRSMCEAKLEVHTSMGVMTFVLVDERRTMDVVAPLRLVHG
jgi:hypothetical protein